MSTLPIAVKFVSWDVPALETLKDSKVYLLREKLNNSKKLDREEKDWLAYNLISNAYFRNAIPLSGYRFDFSDVVKKYVVNHRSGWCEYYAPDKTSLRSVLNGRIDKIIEVK